MKRVLFLLSALMPGVAAAQATDADSLYGVHWYGTTDLSQVAAQVAPNPTDAESMAPGRRMWVLEINHLDGHSPAGQSNAWDRPNYYNNYNAEGTGGYSAAVIGNGKGHSLIYRLQPNWSRHVPYSGDPYTTAMFAADAAGAAQWHRNFCRVWQIGNEVNLRDENRRWGGAAYDVPWEPTPAQYAETYVAARDAIHTVTPNTAVAKQIVLMQPVSPGNVDAHRFMDGAEFLWRQIEAVEDQSKIDGFALHAYAEPGGANDGVDGFMDGLREQIMVIDQLGHGDKPLFITEFNKHMPSAGDAAVGARFVQKAYEALNAWNTGVGDVWPGQPNNEIAGAMWFIFRRDEGGWKDYSLQYQKTLIGGTDPNVNPWYGFQAAAGHNYPAGAIGGGGPLVDHGALWWEDQFDSLDTTSGLPHWRTEVVGGTITPVAGKLRLHGTTGVPNLNIATKGYVYGDFRAETTFAIVNGAQVNPGAGEANVDLRIREGSSGYSLTFFSSASDVARRNRVILRRANEWTQIGPFNQEIGIANGDAFRVTLVANGPVLRYRIYKNGEAAPVTDWEVNDGGQRVGWLRVGSYNMAEARLDHFALGGKDWPGVTEAGWQFY